MSSVGAAVVATDLDGRITAWNDEATRLFGRDADEVVGRSVDIIVPPDGAAADRELRARVGMGERIADIETYRRRRDGTLVTVAVTMAPVTDESGAVTGIVRILGDLPERGPGPRASQRLVAIVESSDDAIASKDLTGMVTSWNHAAERMFGYTAAEIVGRSIRLIIPDDRQDEEDEVLARVRRGERVEHFETLRQRKDGTIVPVSLTISPILDAHGTVIGASKIARDVSERRRTEIETAWLALENARLYIGAQQANRLKDEFLATLSHELRTPLNAIVGYARMLRAGVLGQEQWQRAVESIDRNAASLTQIVEDVLDVSRFMSGETRLAVQSVNLRDTVRHAVDAVMSAAEAGQIHLDMVIDPRVPPVSGDPRRLQQVAWNLLSNAVKFTPRDGRVQIRVEPVDASVEIVVSDTGIGIAPEFLPHVFETFRQENATASRERGGLGLGLAIARELVEMHGGTLRAASGGVGQGATFVVRLPVGVAPHGAEEPAGPRGGAS